MASTVYETEISFVGVSVNNPKNKTQIKDYSHFNQELYKQEISVIDWNAIINGNTDINDLTSYITGAIRAVVDKHVPIKKQHQEISKSS